jgi:outer membrane scaffolding protein for murein synthesis (MipA/OmpV family)
MNHPRRVAATTQSLAAIAMAASMSAQSQPAEVIADTSKTGPPGSSWGVGLAVGYERELYKDFDNKVKALPLLTYENEWVSLFGPRLDAKLPTPRDDLSLRLRLAYRGDGYEADDSPVLTGMAERKGGLWAGAAIAWDLAFLQLSAEWAADVSSHSKGQRLKLQAEHDIQLGKLKLTPRLGFERLDAKTVDYYYGVRSDEARVDRPAYRGQASWNVEAGARLGYAFTGEQSLFLDLSARRYDRHVRDSPLVDRSHTEAIRAGYLYRF